MKLSNYLFIPLICCICVSADISITGTVQKRDNGRGIPGVQISLSNRNDLTAVSDQNGYFEISDASISVTEPSQDKPPVKVSYRKNSLVFAEFVKGRSCDIRIYSDKGKNVFRRLFTHLKTENTVVRLPRLAAGHYILVVKINGVSYNSGFICMDNDYIFRSVSDDLQDREGFPLAKRNASADTLVAVKTGYDTARKVIDSYNTENLIVNMDSVSSSRGLTIYFIRHAETVANATDDDSWEANEEFTELGETQVQELKGFLINENIEPDHVVVSPTWRTQKTIEPFLIEENLTAEIWGELNECCGGEPTGETLPDTLSFESYLEVEIVAENTEFRSEDDAYYYFPESYEEGLYMVMIARDRLLERYSQSGKTVIVVGHAGNGELLLGLLRGYDMLNETPERRIWLQNTGVQKLQQDSVTGEIELIDQNINDPSR